MPQVDVDVLGPAPGRLIAVNVATDPHTATVNTDHAPFDVAWAIDVLRHSAL
jgi:hypothetical protein